MILVLFWTLYKKEAGGRIVLDGCRVIHARSNTHDITIVVWSPLNMINTLCQTTIVPETEICCDMPG